MPFNDAIIQKIMVKLIIIGFIVLFAYQIIIEDNDRRQNIIMVDKLEGKEIDEGYNELKDSYITIEMLSEDINQDIRVLINGKYIKNIVHKNTDIYVNNNDVIELDARNMIKPVEINILYNNCYNVFNFKPKILLEKNIKILARIKI